jgi:uncharacterized protein (TIGR03083 family)
MNKQEYIERLVEERQNVMKALEGLSDEQMSRPMAEGKWSVRDVLGHLAAWENEVVKAFEQKARGQRPTIADITDYDSWNAAEAEKRKYKSVEDIRHELKQTRKRLLTILNDLPEDESTWSPERSTAKMMKMLIEHDRHHWKAICEFRQMECG